MNDALPALNSGLMTSVMAPFGSPPSVAASKKAIPVGKRAGCVAGGEGNLSARRLRRSTILFRAATRALWHDWVTCSSEHYPPAARVQDITSTAYPTPITLFPVLAHS